MKIPFQPSTASDIIFIELIMPLAISIIYLSTMSILYSAIPPLIYVIFYLGHLRLALSCQEAQIVDLILDHEVLLFTLKVLGSEDKE